MIVIFIAIVCGITMGHCDADPPDARVPSATEADASADEIDPQAKIEQWVAELSSNSYLRRKRATSDLMRVGRDAVDELVAELDSGDLETTERVITILQEISVRQPLSPTANETSSAENSLDAWTELQRIATLGGSRGVRAKVATKEVREVRKGQAVELLEAAGVFVGITDFIVGARKSLQRIVQVDDSFRGETSVLELLRWIDGIEYARVKGSAIRRDVLAGIIQMPDLKTLSLLQGEVSADDLKTLGGMQDLRHLEFRYVPISGDLIGKLATLPIRVSLTLNGTSSPIEAVDALRQTVPGLEIDFKQGGFLGVMCFDNFNECVVNEVIPGKAAERAGLLPGDEILEVDGKPIKAFKDLQAAINAHVPGDSIQIRYQRAGSEHDTSARLGKLDDN